MVHGLARSEFGYRGKNPEGIGGQEDDLLGMPSLTGNDGIIAMVNGIADPRIFRDRFIGKIDGPGLGIVNHVFQQSPETNGTPDIRFFFRRKVDAFGVTTAFKIEDAIV